MTDSQELIILAYTKFKDNSIIVHTLSREYGRKGFIVKIGKRTSMSFFMPLNIIEAKITKNPKSDLWWASQFSAVYPLIGIRNNLYKNTMTMFISEVLYRVIKDGVNEEGLYDWCVKSILTLDAMENNFSNYHIRFLLELSAALGFKPAFTDILPFANDHQEDLKNFIELPFEESMLLPLNGLSRNSIAETIIRYLEYHTESSINVKSLKVLRELYE